MSGIGFVQWDESRIFVAKLIHFFPGSVFGAVVCYYEPCICGLRSDAVYGSYPLSHHILYVGFFIIGGHYEKHFLFFCFHSVYVVNYMFGWSTVFIGCTYLRNVMVLFNRNCIMATSIMVIPFA